MSYGKHRRAERRIAEEVRTRLAARKPRILRNQPTFRTDDGPQSKKSRSDKTPMEIFCLEAVFWPDPITWILAISLGIQHRIKSFPGDDMMTF